MLKVSELKRIDFFFLSSFIAAGSLYYIDITAKNNYIRFTNSPTGNFWSLMTLLFHMWIKINGQKWQKIIWEKKEKCVSSRFEFLTLSSGQVNTEAPQTQSIMILGKNIGDEERKWYFPSHWQNNTLVI